MAIFSWRISASGHARMHGHLLCLIRSLAVSNKRDSVLRHCANIPISKPCKAIIDATRKNMKSHPLTIERYIKDDNWNAQSLTCSARIRLQADTVTQADGMPSETPASPPA